ncbi:MAG TPA: septal ring lytic transglycosylase RlpA family protein [Terracidiphilus sp.]|nr:septal ring lytic transglycosylase RlpA family protein [Terracidiphilus sp.]
MTAGGALVTVFTATVHADAPLPRPASTLPPTASWAAIDPDSPAPKSPKRRHDMLHGIASWYGSVFDGHRTASGESFDMNALTACHPSLPFGTLVRVVNLANKRSVVVRINDRGPLGQGRVIDLSYAAAGELDITQRGLARVTLEVLSLGQPRPRNH